MAGEDSAAAQTDTTVRIYPVTFSLEAFGQARLPMKRTAFPLPVHAALFTHPDQVLDTQRNLAKT
jgi:hypothetical protein